MSRPDIDTYFMSMASLVATRSTCLRRAVGCVLVNERNHVIATGYNGVAAGMTHCNEPVGFYPDGVTNEYPNACEGATLPSGEGLDKCQAIHAEQNAIAQCRDVFTINTCYVTVAPCMSCLKLFLNTSCQRIVFSERYAHLEAQTLWEKLGRIWSYIP